MALIPLYPDDFRFNSVRTHPRQTFSSSSLGVVGDVFLFAERSKTLKNIDLDLQEYIFDINSSLEFDGTAPSLTGVRGSAKYNIQDVVSQYLESASKMAEKLDQDKKLITYRFEMPHRFNDNTIRKSIFINNLLPFYQSEYDHPMNFSFSNYHSLNFFTSTNKYPSNVPSDSALIYPVEPIFPGIPKRFFPNESFSFEFYINPRYTTDTSADSYDAGTILHMPNAYCISLLSGSGKDSLGRPDTFRLSIQLGPDAQKNPKELVMPPNSELSGSIDNKTFISEDFHLSKNTWSYCAIRWGGKNINSATGSFYIDGKSAGDFVIKDDYAIVDNRYVNSKDIPPGLVVGNRYEASNDKIQNKVGDYHSTADRASKMSFIFTPENQVKYGTEILLSGSHNEEHTHDFTNPLNAELQEVRIFSRYRTNEEILSTAQNGFYDWADPRFLFYLSPYFIPESNSRLCLKTISQAEQAVQTAPFNIDLSFGLGARSINLENFVIDLVSGKQPRCYQLEETTASPEIEKDFSAYDFDFMPATDALYLRPQNRKRNLTILPSDLGNLGPNFDILDARAKAVVTGSYELGIPGDINLKNMVNFYDDTHEIFSFLDDDAGNNPDSIANSLLANSEVSVFTSTVDGVPSEPVVKSYDEVYGDTARRISLTILNRTKDVHSNEITFFDISNIFYGDKIKEESFFITDKEISGSAGRVNLSFKDNGRGQLYRCNATGSHPHFASAGKILYEEGLVALLNPAIPPFGKNSFELDFLGDRNIHVLEMRVPIEAEQAISSSNSTFQHLKPTDLPADEGRTCNLITNMYFHDENMNVIGKVNLSRPIVRKQDDKYVFKFKMDF